MGAFAAPIIGGVAAAGAGALFNKFFGPKPPKVPQPGSAFTPGLNFTRSGNSIFASRSPELQGLFGQLSDLAQGQAGQLSDLLGQVIPGFSALRSSRLAGLENNRRRTIGDLRENLARRRIAGSSFANDAMTRAELGFQEEADRIRSESFLQSLDAFNKILTQKYSVLSSNIQAQISQANLEAQLGTNFASGVQTNLTSIFNTQAQLAAQSSAGLGQFFQPAVSSFGKAAGNYFGSLFSGGGSSASSSTPLVGNYNAGFT